MVDLAVSPTIDNRFILLKPYKFENIMVPKGYKTNGANIPRLLWLLVPPFKPINGQSGASLPQNQVRGVK